MPKQIVEGPPPVPGMVDIYTDGSGRYPVGGTLYPGGFAFVAVFVTGGVQRILRRYGWVSATTSNQMELAAIYAALSLLPKKGYPLRIFTDSEYCHNALTEWVGIWERRGWTNGLGAPVANRELILACSDEHQKHASAGGAVHYFHVRGHSGVRYNEEADRLAGFSRVHRFGNIPTPLVIPGLDHHVHQTPRRVVPV